MEGSLNPEEYGGANQYGRLLIQLRRGETPHLEQTNNYLFEAVELKGLLYTLPELKDEFPRVFENPLRPLVLEVGCYWGHNVVELAKYNPHINVIGMDIKYKRVVKSCEKIKKGKLTNAKIALCDIRELIPILPEKSVYGMLIFFPDPWIKGKHRRFRFLMEDFFKSAFSRLSDDGFIWLKTDHKDYYEAGVGFAKRYNYEIVDRLPGNLEPREYKSIFETIFLEQHLPVYQLLIRKEAANE
jgi:tRNA (guanine-N7-)-methyltransferase